MQILILSEVTEAMSQYVNGNSRVNQGLGHSTVPEGQALQKGQLASSLLPISLTCACISGMNLDLDHNHSLFSILSRHLDHFSLSCPQMEQILSDPLRAGGNPSCIYKRSCRCRHNFLLLESLLALHQAPLVQVILVYLAHP